MNIIIKQRLIRENVDDIDLHIIKLFQRNLNLTRSQIAQEVDRSQTKVDSRIKKMKKMNYFNLMQILVLKKLISFYQE